MLFVDERERASVRAASGNTSGLETIALAVAFAGALLPIVAAVLRAMAEGWIPIGDSAYFMIRSRDVLTEHHPLLGAWSSGSVSMDDFVNNPGPLQLDLLAPFTKIAPAAGTALGVGLTNALAVVGIGWTARRLGGPLVAAVALAGAATVTWSMGSAMLIEPRQHPAMVLPFLCYLIMVWAVAAGRSWALPWATLAGSLVLQTHLSYALLVPLLAAWGVVGIVIHGRRVRRSGDVEWAAWWPNARRSVIVAGVVATACWIQPLVDQFWGRQNLSGLLRASGRGSGAGFGTAGRMVADVVGLPPFWGRSSFREFAPGTDLPGALASTFALGAIVALLAFGMVHSRRAGRPVGVAGAATAIVALVGAAVSAARLPVGAFGVVSANYRWLWAVGAFWAVAAIVALWPAGKRAESRGLAAFSGAAALLGLAGLPATYQSDDPSRAAHQLEVTRDLIDQLAPLGDRDIDPVLVDRTTSPFGEPFTYVVIGELQALDIEFRFSGDPQERYRFGDRRLPQGDEQYRMTFAYGDAVSDTPAGAERVAVSTGLDESDSAELTKLQERVAEALVTGSMQIEVEAARTLSDREFPTLDDAIAGRPVHQTALFHELTVVDQLGLVSAPAVLDDDLSRFLELVDLRLMGSVAVYLTPIA